MKSFTCKASNDIVIISKRDRNEAAVVMQLTHHKELIHNK